MRILMLHNRYKVPGGEDVSTLMQVELLRSNGHTVELFEESNDRIEILGVTRTAARAIWSPQSYSRINALLDADRFDVMHVQNFFPLLSPSVYYAANGHGIPVVQSLRNFRLICPEGMLYRDGRACTECVGKRFASPGVRHSCYRQSRAGTAVVASISTAHRIAGTWRDRVSLYVTPSEFAAAMYAQGGWNPDSILTIPNSVHPDPGAGSGTGGYALLVSRLVPQKGIETLLDAWRYADVSYPLKIAGDGPLRSAVERAASLNPSISYLGPVPLQEAYDLMGHATFVVVPTTGVETFGRVAAEALAKGTPALVSDLGGLTEIVDDGVTGWLVKPGDHQHLADRVVWMIEHRDGVAKMRRRARTAFVERFSSDRVVQQWVTAYRDVIDKGRS